MMSTAIAQVYADLVRKGKKTIGQVPASIREEVRKILEVTETINAEEDAE